jgi:hypothetical protein
VTFRQTKFNTLECVDLKPNILPSGEMTISKIPAEIFWFQIRFGWTLSSKEYKYPGAPKTSAEPTITFYSSWSIVLLTMFE